MAVKLPANNTFFFCVRSTVFSLLLSLPLSILMSVPGLVTLSFAEDDVNKVVVIRPESTIYESILEGLADNLEEEVEFVDLPVEKPTVSFIESAIDEHSPKSIILLDNKAFNAYWKYKKTENSLKIPAIVLASAFLDQIIQGLENTTGILYEIPIVVSIVNLRGTVNDPVKNVGVLYRKQFQDSINQNKVYSKFEKINLIAVELSEKPSSRELKKGLKKLKKANIDALWITNDSGLLQPKFVKSVWVPFLKRYRKPVVVGVENLISNNLNFGNYAVFPDHYSLGSQAASILDELIVNDWEFEDTDLQVPFSVKTSINMDLVKKRKIKINRESLKKLDNIIGEID